MPINQGIIKTLFTPKTLPIWTKFKQVDMSLRNYEFGKKISKPHNLQRLLASSLGRGWDLI